MTLVKVHVGVINPRCQSDMDCVYLSLQCRMLPRSPGVVVFPALLLLMLAVLEEGFSADSTINSESYPFLPLPPSPSLSLPPSPSPSLLLPSSLSLSLLQLTKLTVGFCSFPQWHPFRFFCVCYEFHWFAERLLCRGMIL